MEKVFGFLSKFFSFFVLVNTKESCCNSVSSLSLFFLICLLNFLYFCVRFHLFNMPQILIYFMFIDFLSTFFYTFFFLHFNIFFLLWPRWDLEKSFWNFIFGHLKSWFSHFSHCFLFFTHFSRSELRLSLQTFLFTRNFTLRFFSLVFWWLCANFLHSTHNFRVFPMICDKFRQIAHYFNYNYHENCSISHFYFAAIHENDTGFRKVVSILFEQ